MTLTCKFTYGYIVANSEISIEDDGILRVKAEGKELFCPLRHVISFTADGVLCHMRVAGGSELAFEFATNEEVQTLCRALCAATKC